MFRLLGLPTKTSLNHPFRSTSQGCVWRGINNLLVEGLTDASRLADWLTYCPKGWGQTANRDMAVHWVAKKLRTNYFEIYFKLSGLVAARQPCNPG